MRLLDNLELTLQVPVMTRKQPDSLEYPSLQGIVERTLFPGLGLVMRAVNE